MLVGFMSDKPIVYSYPLPIKLNYFTEQISCMAFL